MDDKLGGYNIGEKLYYWLVQNLPVGKTILELGSGDGTDLLLGSWNVISVEHDQEYQIRRKGKYKHKLLKVPIQYNKVKNFPNDVGWYDVAVLEKKIKQLHYDILLVDGPPGVIGRGGFENNISIFNLLLVNKLDIILDDTHNRTHLRLARILKTRFGFKIEEFEDDNKKFSILKNTRK